MRAFRDFFEGVARTVRTENWIPSSYSWISEMHWNDRERPQRCSLSFAD
ncbi:unnamed protein product [Chondrus crispus]|uniref:Uncharacterized protein n=1 Tax=Chondrus crispus TaxID=2769 RepID=R7Q7K1_CHOCR|nr:unnamed protein product [Chondrus crispus]CDF34497.1 unnamed protein product [Chondrus crispus]|eukprot:XP_005714316.1 unnamed protein product [Chondrus crispus]